MGALADQELVVGRASLQGARAVRAEVAVRAERRRRPRAGVLADERAVLPDLELASAVSVGEPDDEAARVARAGDGHVRDADAAVEHLDAVVAALESHSVRVRQAERPD